MNIKHQRTESGASPTDVIGAENIFQPDTILAAEYFESLRRKTLAPEKTLMLAVLEDAVRCFQDNILAESGKKKLLFDEAEEWLFTDDSDWLFSFVSISAVLGLDPGYIRRGLKRWEEGVLGTAERKQPRIVKARHRLVA